MGLGLGLGRRIRAHGLRRQQKHDMSCWKILDIEGQHWQRQLLSREGYGAQLHRCMRRGRFGHPPHTYWGGRVLNIVGCGES